ncbi:mycofactocin biosynthesis glycosyltransferase MftF [Williamsia sp. 1135]|uniref:mycofactocin biosynthesis glycosyltransferase MftF n=1 Tax=Williamsia sp. 1135 TaxID=1889262 RepID=UPI000A11C65B|nr:mycofactocin biosynthesis glycosyltransferase MftF [Williamsia sp. 1135]ORM24994.1 mycofactocin system glycosyltransferase [Williamsia sp. 1135]
MISDQDSRQDETTAAESPEVVDPKASFPPHGFQVQIDSHCTVSDDRRHIVGGSPLRLLNLSQIAGGLLDADGRLAVHNRLTSQLARKLLDAGVGHPRPMFGPAESDVTVVVPVRDNQSGIDRLIAGLGGHKVVIVDDGSVIPVRAPGATVLRTERSKGPAAARNRGAAGVTTEFLAFLDSDVVPEHDWLTKLLGHFSDPKVALVAPRIVALDAGGGATSRYEALCSSLDMGRREGPIAPRSRIPYVPSAAMVMRRNCFEGFDETMEVAEDVDLCWRLHELGWSLRYDPIATVAHDHRSQLSKSLDRKRYYGTGAALLSGRHPGLGAPLALTVPMAAAMAALITGTAWGVLAALVVFGVIGGKLHKRVSPMPDAARMAAKLTAQSVGFGLLQSASALCRHYWPLSFLLALVSKRFRTLLVAVAVGEAAYEWVRLELVNPEPGARVGWWRFMVLKRLDDLAYGTGLWQGALAGRSADALYPRISNTVTTESRPPATHTGVG